MHFVTHALFFFQTDELGVPQPSARHHKMNNSTSSGDAPSSPMFSLILPNVTAAIFVVLLMILTLFGNIIVCASFYTFRDLRTICNYFVISLSASDILVALLAMPFWLILQMTTAELDSRILGSHVRKFWDFIDILCGTASIMNLAAVSADRQLAITVPYSYAEHVTSKRAIVVICGVWVYSLTVAGVRFAGLPNNGYFHFNATFSFFVPLSFLLVMYARIFMVARDQAKRIGRNYAHEIKAAKTIAVVIGAFVICWLPFFVLVLGYAYDKKFPVSMKVYKALKWMEYLNSCLNPIIYCCLNRTYRRAFRKLFTRCKKRVQRDQENSLAENTVISLKNYATVSSSSNCSSDNKNGNKKRKYLWSPLLRGSAENTDV